ncbi:humps family-domain-containing protein [Russula earlei]|uniref:Humps family-domain-containing protein n=1 Tax=Russula earlei TaxID=71964 RepID=A0ACC0ULX0_9AGAM|nr:humps family-domain-containing protein [Russula earlei]
MAYLNTYADRAKKFINPSAKLLLETIERKQSNLCVSVDVTSSKEFLAIIDAVGPYVSLIKTHIDIIDDFEFSLIHRLQELSIKHNFLIFEDRKFADIGNTVALQYSSGVHRIATWAHITNAHPVPGPSIIKGLASVGLPLNRGLLLLAEMSTAGALARGPYTEDAVRMARDARDFVIGFIAQHRMEGVGLCEGQNPDEAEDFLILTPGVGLDATNDGLGQQYRTPEDAILGSGCDVIIVGRGIYGRPGNMDIDKVQRQSERYREAGWNAYLQRLKSRGE